MDVLEIDGASNRGIDEVRNLRESVKFKPVSGRFKIYIIDEVHMLTTEAFNALLKTLEEPPAHVKFVFATTESHKVPLTILSRCQRFHFKRIKTEEIVSKLEEIAKSEKIKTDKAALFLIARASDGALRDAEGLLDQLASFSEDQIQAADVLSLLGLASDELYFEALDAIRSKDAAKVFGLIQDLYDQGKDLALFVKGLFDLFRNLLLVQCTDKAVEFIEAGEETKSKLAQKKNVFTRGELLLGLSILENLQGQIRRNLASPRILAETALLKLLHLDGLKTVEDLISKGPIKVTAGFSAVPSEPSSISPSPLPSYGGGEARKPASSSAAPVLPSGPPSARAEIHSRSAATAVAAAGSAVMDGVSFKEVEEAWPRIIEYVKSKRMSNGIFLSESSPVEISGFTVTLGFAPDFQFHKDTLEKDANRKLIEEAFEVILAKRIKVLFVITQAEVEDQAPPVPAPQASVPAGSKLPEIIDQAMNIFDSAKLVRKDP